MKRELQPGAHQALMAERDDMIVALLEERGYTTTELAELCDLRSGMAQLCAALARRGRIIRLADRRWALPGHRPAPAVDVDALDDELAADAEIDPDALDEPSPPHAPAKTPKPRPGLRQAHERPLKQIVNTAESLSWWATHPREGFSQTAQQQLARMRISREAGTIPFRILQ